MGIMTLAFGQATGMNVSGPRRKKRREKGHWNERQCPSEEEKEIERTNKLPAQTGVEVNHADSVTYTTLIWVW